MFIYLLLLDFYFVVSLKEVMYGRGWFWRSYLEVICSLYFLWLEILGNILRRKKYIEWIIIW